jgi:hypothetical protein
VTHGKGEHIVHIASDISVEEDFGFLGEQR